MTVPEKTPVKEIMDRLKEQSENSPLVSRSKGHSKSITGIQQQIIDSIEARIAQHSAKSRGNKDSPAAIISSRLQRQLEQGAIVKRSMSAKSHESRER